MSARSPHASWADALAFRLDGAAQQMSTGQLELWIDRHLPAIFCSYKADEHTPTLSHPHECICTIWPVLKKYLIDTNLKKKIYRELAAWATETPAGQPFDRSAPARL